MLSQADVIEALRPVHDPELHRSIVDLGMVKTVDIEQGGRVGVLIALTVAGCPMRSEITARVTNAVAALDGVTRVDVEMTVMTPEELAELRGTVSTAGTAAESHDHGDHAGHAHGPTKRVIPFANPRSHTRVLAITSGKGGVGKSSITVNLAVALAELGHDVAVLDADVYGFSVPGMLGVDDEPDVIDGMVVPPSAHGVQCISLGFFVEEDHPVMWRGPMLHKALEQFLVDVEWGSPDYLLVDMPPGTGDVAISMAGYVPGAEVYVVTTPQLAAQRVAQRSGALARELRLPIAGVIENMSWLTTEVGGRLELFGAGGGAALATQLNVPLLAQVPFSAALQQGGDSGVPVAVSEPTGDATLALATLAKTIEGAGPRRRYRDELRVR